MLPGLCKRKRLFSVLSVLTALFLSGYLNASPVQAITPQEILDKAFGTMKNLQKKFFPTTQQSVSTTTIVTSSDLDVSFIERTPRYYRYCLTYPNDIPTLCAGTENQKRWPDIGEPVTYIAHIRNKGEASPQFAYQWIRDNTVVANGYASPISVGGEVTVEYKTAWPASPQVIQFKADPQNAIGETVETNNSLTIGSHDLTISIWIEKGLYDIFNRTPNLMGSSSFEDWIQAHFAKMNERFSQAKYPVAPNGIKDRVRIDQITVAEELDGINSPLKSDQNEFLIDGRWQFTDSDDTNVKGLNGAWQNYVNSYATIIDWGLIHELAHQLGVIDLYRLNLANDPNNNNRVQIKDQNGNILPYSALPTVAWGQIIFAHPGRMGGGDVSPYSDDSYFESHTAGGLNSHYNARRGYYGEYLFDIPSNNYLKLLDLAANPLVGVSVALYQKDARTEYFDNIPEITGITDGQGTMLLLNRPVIGVTTATGHTLRNNPFGQVNVVGTNGTMIVKITKGSEINYRFLTILDFNLAYWLGNRESATYTINTDISASPGMTPAPTPVVSPSPTPASSPRPTVFPSTTPTVKIKSPKYTANDIKSLLLDFYKTSSRWDLNRDKIVNGIDFDKTR